MGYGFGKYSFLEGTERLRVYRETASHGDLTSMKELAYILKNEMGSLQELQESFKWYLRAATSKDNEAILNVGDMLRDGIGTEQNPVAAIEYYKKVVNAPRAHHTERKSAANKIAYTYEKYLNDGEKAVKWLKKSVLLGNRDARLKIAEIYRDGRGLKPDGEKAIEWFTKILNDKSLSESERFAAAFEIAKMFRKGIGVEQSDEKSVKFFKLAAKSNLTIARTACNELVKIYCASKEITPNVGMAIHWLRKSSELGSKKATFTLAKIFRDGADGVNQNGEKALKFLEETASNNFDTINKVAAMRIIAEMYAKGLAVAEDKEKADRLYREAAQINSEWNRALNNLQNFHALDYDDNAQVTFDTKKNSGDDILWDLKFKYTHLSSGGIQIDKYIYDETYVTVPNEIEGQPVTNIGYRAFDNANLKKIAIPSNVKTIVYGAVMTQEPLKIYFQGSQIQVTPQSFIAPEIEIYFDKVSLLETLKKLEEANKKINIRYESPFFYFDVKKY